MSMSVWSLRGVKNADVSCQFSVRSGGGNRGVNTEQYGRGPERNLVGDAARWSEVCLVTAQNEPQMPDVEDDSAQRRGGNQEAHGDVGVPLSAKAMGQSDQRGTKQDGRAHEPGNRKVW